MNTLSISSTQLKNDTASIINTVIFNNKSIIIEKYGKPVARIVPIAATSKKLTIEDALTETFGSISDFPEVTSYRTFRKKSLTL